MKPSDRYIGQIHILIFSSIAIILLYALYPAVKMNCSPFLNISGTLHFLLIYFLIPRMSPQMFHSLPTLFFYLKFFLFLNFQYLLFKKSFKNLDFSWSTSLLNSPPNIMIIVCISLWKGRLLSLRSYLFLPILSN